MFKGGMGWAQAVNLGNKGKLTKVKKCFTWKGSRYNVWEWVRGVKWEPKGLFKARSKMGFEGM